MVLPASVPDCTGSSRNRFPWEMAAHVHAQGELRSSMTIVSLPLRLSAAACPPPIPEFQTPRSPETEQQTALPTDARIKQQENISQIKKLASSHAIYPT
eukprot:4269452-Pyramimonas_sp.AAC.1